MARETRTACTATCSSANGRAERLVPASPSDELPRVVMPKLTECHVHLDKCYTISRMNGVRGGLQAAMPRRPRIVFTGPGATFEPAPSEGLKSSSPVAAEVSEATWIGAGTTIQMRRL